MSTEVNVQLNVHVPRVDPRHRVYVCGSAPSLGEWNVDRAVRMSDHAFPLWTAQFHLDDALQLPVQYKYLIVDESESPHRVVAWEDGRNRLVDSLDAYRPSEPESGSRCRAGSSADLLPTIAVTDNDIRIKSSPWRGAGVAIPVFSLRSQASMGVGEFLDLKLLVDIAVEAGLQLIQLLPINDTCIEGDWRDTYPYKSISVVALHPQYLRLSAIPGLPVPLLEDIHRASALLNEGSPKPVDYDAMIKQKLSLLRRVFDAVGCVCAVRPACVRVCVRACVRACVRMCVCIFVHALAQTACHVRDFDRAPC